MRRFVQGWKERKNEGAGPNDGRPISNSEKLLLVPSEEKGLSGGRSFSLRLVLCTGGQKTSKEIAGEISIDLGHGVMRVTSFLSFNCSRIRVLPPKRMPAVLFPFLPNGKHQSTPKCSKVVELSPLPPERRLLHHFA